MEENYKLKLKQIRGLINNIITTHSIDGNTFNKLNKIKVEINNMILEGE